MRVKDDAAEKLRKINDTCFYIIVILAIASGIIRGIYLGVKLGDDYFRFDAMILEFLRYALIIFVVWILKLIADCFFNLCSNVAGINAGINGAPEKKIKKERLTFDQIVDYFSPEVESLEVKKEKAKYRKLKDNMLITKKDIKSIDKKM